jgi:hypothetical protein
MILTIVSVASQLGIECNGHRRKSTNSREAKMEIDQMHMKKSWVRNFDAAFGRK